MDHRKKRAFAIFYYQCFFNPAVAIAGGVLNLLPLKTVALYTVVCIAAGLAAAKLFLKIEKG